MQGNKDLQRFFCKGVLISEGIWFHPVDMCQKLGYLYLKAQIIGKLCN